MPTQYTATQSRKARKYSATQAHTHSHTGTEAHTRSHTQALRDGLRFQVRRQVGTQVLSHAAWRHTPTFRACVATYYCVPMCLWACVPAWLPAWRRTECLRACVPTYLHAYVLMCLRAYVPAWIHTTCLRACVAEYQRACVAGTYTRRHVLSYAGSKAVSYTHLTLPTSYAV